MNSSVELIKAQLDLTEQAALDALTDLREHRARGVIPLRERAQAEQARAQLRAVEACRKALTHYESTAAADPEGIETVVQLAIARILAAQQVELESLREPPE
ncbi:hypothetical protein [Sphaerisporangium rhizosphaerae]|uniref:Uncharacterized protein n=1 Tax=Sphaerisporangium rhizosphaerae TaxID=2269375 RepID=A0ABW2P6R7_9ACTN